MCIEREKVDFKSREVNCLKECALALSGDKHASGVAKYESRSVSYIITYFSYNCKA